MTTKITFVPKKSALRLIGTIENERARDVLMRRHGLVAAKNIETLESVGQSYGITRERVRQIENRTLMLIQKSEAYLQEARAFEELARAIDVFGGVAPQDELIKHVAQQESEYNYILFLLHVGNDFNIRKESNEFVHHWYKDDAHSKMVRDTLRALYAELSESAVISEEDILDKYQQHLHTAHIIQVDKEVLLRWLSLSKKIARNPLEEWGRISSPSVRVKGMRDFAYLTLKRNGSPLHFREVAEQIHELFGKDAHIATTHNELIKDARFILVGRGLYALSEWGYSKGVVKEVIADVLRKNGPLTKTELIERVKRERYVKDNTITVNLQDVDIFTRLEDGKYSVVC